MPRSDHAKRPAVRGDGPRRPLNKRPDLKNTMDHHVFVRAGKVLEEGSKTIGDHNLNKDATVHFARSSVRAHFEHAQRTPAAEKKAASESDGESDV